MSSRKRSFIKTGELQHCFLDCRLLPFALCFSTACGGFTDVSQPSLRLDTHIQYDKISDKCCMGTNEMEEDVTKNTIPVKKKLYSSIPNAAILPLKQGNSGILQPLSLFS